jgi:hypothetical protein
MENLEEEIESLKAEILKLKEEQNKPELEPELIAELERQGYKAVKEAAKPIKKRREWRKVFTFILICSRMIVFAAFMYATVVMYTLGRTIESIVLLSVVALWLALNKLEGG